MKRRHHLRILMLVPIVIVLGGAGPASAQDQEREDLVVLTGRAEVAEGDGWPIILDALERAVAERRST